MKDVGIKHLMIIVGCLQILLYSSCKEDDKLGYNQAINPLWEYNYKVGYTGGIIPVIHDNKVMFSSLKETSPDGSANDKLIALDKASGKLIWEWSDLFWDKYENFDENSNKPIFENILAFAIGSRNYTVNLNDGTTSWKNKTGTSDSHVGINNDQIYRTVTYSPADIGIFSDQILEASIHTGEWHKVFEVSGGDSLRQSLSIPVFLKDSIGDEIMIMHNSTIEETGTKNYTTPYLISYNRTKEKINYEVQLDEPGLYSGVDWFPIVENDKVYLLVGKLIKCYDLKTGKEIWSRRFNGDFLFSGALLDNGKIYANRDGSDPTLYCIDAETGSIIWETPSAGTSSPLQLHKGVLYFVGGSDGLFHCVNAATGKFIYSIKAPSQYKDHNDFFSRGCSVDHDTDKIYVASYTTAYCYPTVTLK
jgi:outer membrane protein assembly factor BamB